MSLIPTIGIRGPARVLRALGQCRQYHFKQILPTSFCHLQMKLVRDDKALGGTQGLSGKGLLLTLPSTSVKLQSQTCPAQLGNPGHLLERLFHSTQWRSQKRHKGLCIAKCVAHTSFSFKWCITVQLNCSFPKMFLYTHFTANNIHFMQLFE